MLDSEKDILKEKASKFIDYAFSQIKEASTNPEFSIKDDVLWVFNSLKKFNLKEVLLSDNKEKINELRTAAVLIYLGKLMEDIEKPNKPSKWEFVVGKRKKK